MDITKLKEYAKGMSILIVEDSRSLQALSNELFSRIFDYIDIAGNGEEGLRLYQSKWHDIIISDINMPIMDGITMIKKIKEIDWDQNVVIFSAHGDCTNLSELINLNISHFLSKPISYKNMLNVIYPIVRKLHIERETALLEQEVEEHDTEMQIVLDLIDNGIAILIDGMVYEANEKLLEFMGIDSIENLSFDKIFIKEKGYISGLSNAKLIEYLMNDDGFEHKVMVGLGEVKENIRVYNINCRKISARNKYVLCFSDITRYEQELSELKSRIYTDPLTGLPNKEALINKIMILHKPNSLIHVVTLSVKNHDKIAKYYGEQIEKETELFLISQLKKQLKEFKLESKVFFGIYNPGEYLFVVHNKLINKLLHIITETDIAYKFNKKTNNKTEIVTPTLCCKKVIIPHLISKDIIMKKIENTFKNASSDSNKPSE